MSKTYTATIHDDDRGLDLIDATTGHILPEEGVDLTIYDERGHWVATASYHTTQAEQWEPDKITAALAFFGYAPVSPLTETPAESFTVAPTTTTTSAPCLPHAVAYGQ